MRWKQLDFILLALVLMLCLISLVVLTSASVSIASDPYYYAKKQLLWFVLGIIGLALVVWIDYHQFRDVQWYLYGLNLLLLAMVLFAGHEAKGAQRWINLGPFLFQPSEFSKLILIITLACFLENRKLERWQDFLWPLGYVLLPILLILKQPDLGTALVLLAILWGMLFFAGANIRILLGGTLAGLVLAVGLLYCHFHYGLPIPLKDYQLRRLVVFLDPYNDGQGGTGAGYHIIQSQIAIGSGGWWGVGYCQGSQVQLNFLPEHHTDFIFSLIGEELGFLRSAMILLLYFLIIYRMLQISSEARDPLGSLLVGGVVSMLAFHVMVNVGMTMGVMPVVGIPLPFLSYGGSSILTNMMALGLVLNVYMRRKKILF
ncbi:MAG TPA: rod shape-determining protein RodA [Moorella mulderi]|nr:rod shape-determining protein RodA [Moorella mulderi]